MTMNPIQSVNLLRMRNEVLMRETVDIVALDWGNFSGQTAALAQ